MKYTMIYCEHEKKLRFSVGFDWHMFHLKVECLMKILVSNATDEKTRGAREPKSKPLVEKTKCVRFESCGGWSKFLVPATDIHSQKQL